MKEFENVAISLARKAIENFVIHEKELEIDLDELPSQFSELGAVFVSIYNKEELRGCIGFPYPIFPLAKAIIKAAIEACRDPRFEPIKKEELGYIKIEISILSEMRRIDNKVKNREEIIEKLDTRKGYMIICESRSALFLPQVWSLIKDKISFLQNLCIKAGLNKDCWLSKKTQIYEFEAKIIREE